jgi:hypothetical protein
MDDSYLLLDIGHPEVAGLLRIDQPNSCEWVRLISINGLYISFERCSIDKEIAVMEDYHRWFVTRFGDPHSSGLLPFAHTFLGGVPDLNE